jgi:hypothetical protein
VIFELPDFESLLRSMQHEVQIIDTKMKTTVNNVTKIPAVSFEFAFGI